jgi:hypothetical protein
VTWLLRLYPPPWRRRYGGEVAEMLADRRFSFRIAVDLVAGAIDVWLHPAVTLAAAAAADTSTKHDEEKTMLNRIMRLECAASYGPNVTKADQWKATAVTVGGTLVLTLIWIAARVRIHDRTYIDALSVMAYTIPFLFSMRYTSLKDRPASVQAVFIGGFTLLLTAFMLAVGWLASQI